MLAPPPEDSIREVICDCDLPPEEAIKLVRGGANLVTSYGPEEHVKRKGNGESLLRTQRLAMPRALRRGDVLGNGDRVLAHPRDGYNGSVWVLLSGGCDGHWIKLPARIPVALLDTDADVPDGFVEEMQV